MLFRSSVLLTAPAFALVMTGVIADVRLVAGIVTVLAAVQIVVHMVYFLHMNSKSESGWTLMALIFTAIIVLGFLSVPLAVLAGVLK